MNVEVMEAKGLEAKDANGFSDPYCMLGIIPGNRDIIYEDDVASGPVVHSPLSKQFTAPNFHLNRSSLKGDSSHVQSQPPQQSIAQQHSSGHKSTSLIKRFSSFRKTDKHTSNATNASGSATDKNHTNLTSVPKELKVSKTGVIRGKLPAKLIKTTDVKRETVNPVWMEKFKL